VLFTEKRKESGGPHRKREMRRTAHSYQEGPELEEEKRCIKIKKDEAWLIKSLQRGFSFENAAED